MGHPVAAGRIEVLLTRQVQQEPNEWECLVRPGRKIGVGERLFFGEQDELQAEVIGRGEFGERRIRFAKIPTSRAKNAREMGHPAGDFFGLVEKIGHVPLPPYIARDDSSRDRERYQTVYARERGSVAAPTAGLHFTPEILERMRERGNRNRRGHAARGAGNLPAGADASEWKSIGCTRRRIRSRRRRRRRSIGRGGNRGGLLRSGLPLCARWSMQRSRVRVKCGRDRAKPICLFILDTSFRWCRRC